MKKMAVNVPVLTERKRELFRAGYTFIHFVHPLKTLAQDITIEGWDYTLVLDKVQEKQRRHQTENRYKTLLCREELLQKALCIVSDAWERDQESASPWRTSNTYKPGDEDMLIRYVKFLLWKTMDRQPAHRALAVGGLLYGYAPKEVDNLTVWSLDNNNFGHIKQRILSWMTARFAVEVESVPPYQEERICGRPAQPHEIDVIITFLGLFTAWRQWTRRPCHPVSNGKVGDLFDDMISPPSPALGEDRKHALACPVCGGIPQMVKNYNSDRFLKTPLPAPEDTLCVPFFMNPPGSPPDPSASTRRSSPPPLTPADWGRSEAALREKQLRRSAYRGGVLRVVVDGQERRRFHPAQTPRVEFDLEEDAERLEVFGQDQRGDILLAAFLLTAVDAEQEQPLELFVRQARGQTIRLCLPALSGPLTEGMGRRVQLTYQEGLLPAVAAAWERFWPMVASGSAPAARVLAQCSARLFPDGVRSVAWRHKWAPALVVAFLISLGGNVWQWLQVRGLHQPGEQRVVGTEQGAMSHDQLFNVYRVQRGIQSATALGTFVLAHSPDGAPPVVRGLFDPYVTRVAFFRIGTRYAETLALLHSGDRASAEPRVEALIKALHGMQAPAVLSQYLDTVQTLLQQQGPEVLAKFLALFEPLYVAEYAGDATAEAVVLFRAGTWLVNMSLAAAAGDTASLHQEYAAGYLWRELTRLDAPEGVLTALAQMQRLMAQSEMTDGDVKEVLKLVQKIQRIFS